MTITKTIENEVVTIKVDGWLDVETTPEFHKYVEALEEIPSLIYDFEQLEYISSAGVREVVAAYRRQKEAGGTFAVVNVNPDVWDVFSMTGLDKKIDIRQA